MLRHFIRLGINYKPRYISFYNETFNWSEIFSYVIHILLPRIFVGRKMFDRFRLENLFSIFKYHFAFWHSLHPHIQRSKQKGFNLCSEYKSNNVEGSAIVSILVSQKENSTFSKEQIYEHCYKILYQSM